MPTESAILAARDALLALDTLKVAGVVPESTFDAILYGAAAMPTESQILVARDALKTMASLQTAGNFPEIVELALLSLIAEGGSASVTPASIGAEPAFTTLSDAKLGDRTASDATVPNTLGPGTLTAWLGWIANRIKAIVGGANWYTAPATTLATTATHISNTSNPHSTTASQVGAEPAFVTLSETKLPLATNSLRGAVSREVAGTFSPLPTVEGGTTAGTQTYNARVGSYYIVGKICCAAIYIELASKDAAMAGNLTIAGLPFTSAAFLQSATVAQYSGVTFTAGNTQLTARIESSNTKILLFQEGSGIGATVLQATNISASFVIALTATYVIA